MTSEDVIDGTERSTEELSEAVAEGEIPVVIYNLDKMGLPLASVYAETISSNKHRVYMVGSVVKSEGQL